MEESSVWLIALIALAVGAAIGFMLGRSGGQSNQQQELTDQLNEARHELETYKEQVSANFVQTADLVNDLTSSYAAVHKHLAQSAGELCKDPAASKALAAAMQPALPESEEQESVVAETIAEPTASDEAAGSPEAPRDYAPKKPDEEGTLSETFGLKEEAEEESTAQEPASLAELKETEKPQQQA
ncbi:YhcB family protein [Marinobacterium jannaschii]|uniref:YhcB family protein n=1 Tax=Marinobacterium jannaschii TaxID=64970 RepID=UPI000686F855|nr:DUF1043 family protein [Marinobacterium jannaschii]